MQFILPCQHSQLRVIWITFQNWTFRYLSLLKADIKRFAIRTLLKQMWGMGFCAQGVNRGVTTFWLLFQQSVFQSLFLQSSSGSCGKQIGLNQFSSVNPRRRQIKWKRICSGCILCRLKWGAFNSEYSTRGKNSKLLSNIHCVSQRTMNQDTVLFLQIAFSWYLSP